MDRSNPSKQSETIRQRLAADVTAGGDAISVIVPVLNESTHIQRTIESLLAQDAAPLRLELLFVDGGSRDGTREIIGRYARQHPTVKLLENPRRTTPVALNIGLRAAQGKYVAILGAHAGYPPDYIKTCWEELETHRAAGCSGCLHTLAANQNLGAHLAAWCIGHRFASSGKSVRTHREGYADTIPFPVFCKQALIDAGGYDEILSRNQDNEMNERLRAQGHRLYLTARTQAAYYARPGLRSLLAHAYNTGKWNGRTARRGGGLSLYHFAPLALFVTILIALALVPIARQSGYFALLLLWLPIAAHLCMGTVAGIDTAIRQRSAAALLLPPVILAFHLAYGFGTAVGLLGRLPLVAHRQPREVFAKSWSVEAKPKP
ncbi:MAG TPA: glycosyltransferase family 2 protein [Candidatus Angelobacter sp.]|nr:glycosyltransferase family 2 protein [Candidatus Angelobacter sp.]